MKMKVTAIALSTAVLINPTLAAPNRMLGEAAGTSCLAITEAFDRGESDPSGRLIVMTVGSWSMGYLTAVHENMGQQTTVDLLRDLTVERRSNWIARDCRAHPDYVLIQIVRRLVTAIAIQQTKAPSR
jgi:hypothetical protein